MTAPLEGSPINPAPEITSSPKAQQLLGIDVFDDLPPVSDAANKGKMLSTDELIDETFDQIGEKLKTGKSVFKITGVTALAIIAFPGVLIGQAASIAIGLPALLLGTPISLIRVSIARELLGEKQGRKLFSKELADELYSDKTKSEIVIADIELISQSCFLGLMGAAINMFVTSLRNELCPKTEAEDENTSDYSQPETSESPPSSTDNADEPSVVTDNPKTETRKEPLSADEFDKRIDEDFNELNSLNDVTEINMFVESKRSERSKLPKDANNTISKHLDNMIEAANQKKRELQEIRAEEIKKNQISD